MVALGPDCSADAETRLLNQTVLLTPCRGWATSDAGPEDWATFSTIGGVGPHTHLGAAQHYVCVAEGEVELSQLLLVTFGRMATNELRLRVRSRLVAVDVEEAARLAASS